MSGSTRQYTHLTGRDRDVARVVATDLYLVGQLGLIAVSLEMGRRGFNISPGTVNRLLREAGVPLRPSGGSRGRM